MTSQFIWRLQYWLGITPWDRDEPTLKVQEVFDEGNIPAGAVLDLGCGTGKNVIFMAKRGRQAIGLDFVPAAISKARQKARKEGVSDSTKFFVADVTRLTEVDIPRCAFALDTGCFHALSTEGQQRYARGLAETLFPGGWFMLWTVDPKKEVLAFGIYPEAVKAVFEPWFDIFRTERGGDRSRGTTWFWMQRMKA